MSRRGVSLVVAVALGACAPATVENPPPASVDWRSVDTRAPAPSAAARPEDKTRARAEAYAHALASPQFAELAPTLDEVAHFVCGDTEAHGRERIVAAHESLLGMFERRAVAVDRLWLSGSTAALEWSMTAVPAPARPGAAAAEASVAVTGIALLWINEAGAISDIHLYFERAGARAPASAASASPRIFTRTGAVAEATSVGLMQQMVQALEAPRPPDFREIVADDLEIVAFGGPASERGRRAQAQWSRKMRASIGQLDTIIENAWGIGSYAVLEYTVSGRQLASISGIPLVRGRMLRLRFVDVAEARDGRIVRIWRYDDAGALSPSSS